MTERPDLLEGAIAPESNTVLYGHSAAERFLADAYRMGRLHHALLLEGPEGIGKATLAFRLANHIISHPDPAQAPEDIGDPHPDSPVSHQLAAGASHNLMHLRRPQDEKTGKLKSVITVDEVRRLGRFFQQTAGSDNWRIAVIDTADDLNRNAANALLKMLEEPPRHALFLVLSHVPGRLLPTIRSRCMRLALQPLNRDDLASAMMHLKVRFDLESGYDATEGSVARALVMANYGGVDIATLFDGIMQSGAIDDRATIHKLAQTLSAKDREIAYHFFIDHVISHLQQRARRLAAEGKAAEAAAQAERVSAVSEHFDRAETYNLDRFQTVVTLFSVIFD
ncbi:DNA polymerase III subunit delta' [Pseudohoeflea coraliihabitans]|uniref:DNA polymerase III subunit delta n=1 Tax=Pseudohoeflea coraliihabitans TaxID=2860393 RepID=A0ABS6WTJ0_9HYPH|nr:DNA polymerase III subunit delta' [Pseudohoeflea sp. DP4N28-3]MBW3098369.1 DNA polymerase III subunit delta' [Pseudohoeflea sp. DP4N28-3]